MFNGRKARSHASWRRAPRNCKLAACIPPLPATTSFSYVNFPKRIPGGCSESGNETVGVHIPSPEELSTWNVPEKL